MTHTTKERYSPTLPHCENAVYQAAATAVTRTPNWHRANYRSSKSADGRMAAEADRFERKNLLAGKRKNHLDTNRPSHGRTWASGLRDFLRGPGLVAKATTYTLKNNQRNSDRVFASTGTPIDNWHPTPYSFLRTLTHPALLISLKNERQIEETLCNACKEFAAIIPSS